MIEPGVRSAGSTPRTITPARAPGPVARLCASITGVTCTTPGTARSRASRAARPGPWIAGPWTKTWPENPRMRLRRSVRKPFITDMTTISTATDSAMPPKAIQLISVTPPLRRVVRR